MSYSITLTPTKTVMKVEEYISLAGTVYRNSTPVRSATMYLYVNNSKVAETTTDLRGSFLFTWKPSVAGRYQIYVEAYAPSVPPGAPRYPPAVPY